MENIVSITYQNLVSIKREKSNPIRGHFGMGCAIVAGASTFSLLNNIHKLFLDKSLFAVCGPLTNGQKTSISNFKNLNDLTSRRHI